jgi:hypothetical protein
VTGGVLGAATTSGDNAGASCSSTVRAELLTESTQETTYGRRVSATPDRRSAVFTQQSPDVEVSVDGAWWPGAILGWRHDQDGACEVSVRVSVAGGERQAWVDLGDLRLPEPQPAESAGVPVTGAPVAMPTVVLDRAAARRQLVADVLTSPELPAVGAGAGVRSVRSRRRHGGDVTAEFPAVGRESSAGRHRAPAVAGRHRAVDEQPPPSGAAAAPARPEADCLTRPLRLTDRVSRPRLLRPDAAPRR